MDRNLEKRQSCNFFDPNLEIQSPPKPEKPKPRVKKRTSILEIAQRRSTPVEERVSVFAGLDTKRRHDNQRRSKVKGSGSKSVDFAVYRLDTPNLAGRVHRDTEIDLSNSDLGYLDLLYKNSLGRGHVDVVADFDPPATTENKYHLYIGTPDGRRPNTDFYESVNRDPSWRTPTHSPKLIVTKKPAGRRSSLITGGVTSQRGEYDRGKSETDAGRRDLRDPASPNDRQTTAKYLAEPPPPNVVIAKRSGDSKSTSSPSRNSVRFSVVEDAATELVDRMEKSKERKRRKSRDSYTEADSVDESANDREDDIAELRKQLKRTIVTNYLIPRDISPDSDYNSRSSDHYSRSSVASSSGTSSGSCSDSDSGSDFTGSNCISATTLSSSSGSSYESSSESESERHERKDAVKDKHAARGHNFRHLHEDDEVHDGRMLLGEVNSRSEKMSVVCVML